MTSEILIAILGFFGTASGSLIGAFTSSRLTNYRLEQLEKKVDNMNNISERISIVEQRVNSNEQRIEKIESET